MRYAILLRGVNVAGVTMKMAELREVLTSAGFTDVATILASGNVLLTSGSDTVTVKREIDDALRAHYGYEPHVHALDLATLRTIASAYPFERGREGWHDYVLFAPDAAVRADILRFELDPALERAAEGDGVIYWTVPKGDTLGSKLGTAIGKPAFKPHLTSRNLNTVEKLLR